jgi:hypothetical protein
MPVDTTARNPHVKRGSHDEGEGGGTLMNDRVSDGKDKSDLDDNSNNINKAMMPVSWNQQERSSSSSSSCCRLTAQKLQRTIMVQIDGGYQNEFLFAQRFPTTAEVWEALVP